MFNDLFSKAIKYIFEEDLKAIGMCQLVPYTYRSSNIVYLGGVAINPLLGRHGYRYKIVAEIIHRSKVRGCKRIELSVAVTNHKAMGLYEKERISKRSHIEKLYIPCI
jgi:ribosomal protein S18 acetylase RimI-like enzyme